MSIPAKATPAVPAIPAAAPTLPVLPPSVQRHVNAALDPDPVRRDFLARQLEGQALDEADRAIARAAAAAMEPLLRPASPAQIRTWFAPIAAGVRLPPGQDIDRAGFVAAVAMLQLPGSVFTAEAQAEALRCWRFWPAVADVEGLLAPTAACLRGRRAALLRLAERREPPAAGWTDALTAEVRQAVVARFRQRWAEEVAPVMQGQAGAARVPAPSAHLSEGALLERYRSIAAAGGPWADAARARIKALEAGLASAAAGALA